MYDEVEEIRLPDDPLPVVLTEETCPDHAGFHFISMPRQGDRGSKFIFKCPLRACSRGLV